MKKAIRYSLILIMSFCIIIGIITFIPKEQTDVASASTQLLNDGVYMIKNKVTGLNLDVNNAANGNNHNLIQWYETGGRNQMFVLKSSGSDWEIRPFHIPTLSIAVDVQGNTANDNASIVTYQVNNGSNQKYKFSLNADGSYKILTKVSNYSKGIGVRYNSREPGEICVQLPKASASTSWTLELVWNKTYVGKNYSLEANLPAPANHPIYGSPTLISQNIVYNKFVTATHKVKDSTHESFADYFVRFWQYSTPINGVVDIVGPMVQVSPGVKNFSVGGTTAFTSTFGYEESVAYAQENSVTTNIQLERSFDHFKIGASLGVGVSESISNTMKYSQTFSKSVGTSVGMTVTNDTSSPQYYRNEFRGNFYFVVVQVLKYNYDVSTYKSGDLGWWTNYVYTKKSQICYEELFNWRLDDTSVSFTPYKYRYDVSTNKYFYDDFKFGHIIYI